MPYELFRGLLYNFYRTKIHTVIFLTHLSANPVILVPYTFYRFCISFSFFA